MNYKAFVGWFFYGGANATETANYTSSWGLMNDLPVPATATSFPGTWINLCLTMFP